MKKGYLYIALATLFFSTMEIALRLFSVGFEPLQMNFIRFFVGAVVLLPLAVKGLMSRGVRLGFGDFGYFALTGFLCVVVSMTFYQLAILNAPASDVAILFSCNPVFVMPLAALILGEKIRRENVVSMILSVAGILVILNPFKTGANLTGVLLTLIAAATFALYGVAGKQKSARYGGVASTALTFLVGSVEMLTLIFISRVPAVAGTLRGAGLSNFADIPILKGITLSSLPGLLYVGIFVTGLGYAFYLLSMEKTSAATASMVFFIKPALAPVLALLILKETITVRMLFGILFIILGSLVVFLPGKLLGRRKAAQPEPEEE